MLEPHNGIEELESRIRAAFDAEDYQRAVSQAIEGYGPELLGFLVNLLQDHGRASEAFSQACEDMLVGIRTFQWRSQFRTWAFAVTRRAYQRVLRRERRWDFRQLSEVTEPHVLADKVRTATFPYLRTDVKSGLSLLREQLTPTEQTLLILRVDRKLSWRDVALVMADPEGELDDSDLTRLAASCRKQFERTKQRLRTLAEDSGLLDDRE